MGCAFAATGSYFPWLLLAGVGSGIAGCGVFLFGQTIAGPRVAGQWAGLQNGFGNFAGLIGPALTGFLVSQSGHFFAAFVVAAAISVSGVLLWIFAVRLEPAAWAAHDQS
jgi:cyanate permease